jgi:O-antigen/teichoic acid export membrane protein
VTPVLLAMEKLIIPWKLGSEMLSVYMVPYNLTSRYAMIPQGVRLAALPDFSVLEHDEVRALEERAQTALCTLTAPICIAGILALPILIPLWVGAKVGIPASPIAIILLAGFWWNGCSHIPYARLQGIGRPDLITKISLLQLAPYALVVVLAVQMFGIAGAALAWSCRAVFEAFIFFLAARNFGALVRISAPFGLIVTLSAALYFLMSPESVLYMLAQLTLFAIAGIRAARLLATRYRGVYSALLSGRQLPATEE